MREKRTDLVVRLAEIIKNNHQKTVRGNNVLTSDNVCWQFRHITFHIHLTISCVMDLNDSCQLIQFVSL